MLENIIFHFVFLSLFLSAFIWFLSIRQKERILRQVVFPALLLKKIEFPKNRSLVVRMLPFLQEELSAAFKCRVLIDVKLFKERADENFLLPICYLIAGWECDSAKFFLLNESFLSTNELSNYLKEAVTQIQFCFDSERKVWKVHVETV